MEDPHRIPSQSRIMAVLVAMAIILVVVVVLAFQTTRRIITDRDWVAHSLALLAELQETRALLDEAEDQQRGNLLTGDDGFVERFDRRERRFLSNLETLRKLTADHPTQQQRLERFARTAHAKFADMRAMIDARRRLGTEEARRRLAADMSFSRRDEARYILAEMVHAERENLETRVDQSRSGDMQAIVEFAALLLSFLCCLTAFFWMTWRSVTKQAASATELRKSREQFELAVRGSNDGLWDWDIETNQVYFSPRWKSQLGFEDHEIRHHFDEFESRLHPEDHERVMAHVRDYLAGVLPEYSLEFRMRARDGQYRWILARGVALRDAANQPFRMAGSHTDITARKEAETRLAEQNRLLERAMKAERETNLALKRAQALMIQNEKMAGLGHMVAGVAHEINNPLAFITNNVAVLDRDFKELCALVRLYESAGGVIAREAPEIDREVCALRDRVDMGETISTLPELLGRTSEGLKRIRQIVKDLRLFARLDEGEINEADLNAGIASTVTIIQGHARSKDVELRLDLEPLPRVRCHAARVNQVVMNLLSNAIDACNPGGRVTVQTSGEDCHVCIVVSDNGHGIDPAIRARIFDPFFTTKPIGKGTGLGLSISYGIIQDHGGSIEVESTPGQGSRFTVRLPVLPPAKG
jgi:PAS domain S-box-containing protein